MISTTAASPGNISMKTMFYNIIKNSSSIKVDHPSCILFKMMGQVSFSRAESLGVFVPTGAGSSQDCHLSGITYGTEFPIVALFAKILDLYVCIYCKFLSTSAEEIKLIVGGTNEWLRFADDIHRHTVIIEKIEEKLSSCHS